MTNQAQTYVDIAEYPYNPDDMYSKMYYTVCVMDTDGDVIGKVYRSPSKTQMLELARKMASERKIEALFYDEVIG